MSDPPFRAALLVHGAGGGGWEWNVWARVMTATGLAVSAPDLQPVAAGLAATRLEDYTAQVRTALAALPKPRVVAGASLGGLLALMCADAADALVLVNPLPPSPWNDGLPPARAAGDVVPWCREARLDGTRRALPDADDATALFAFRHWRDESSAVLAQARAGVALPLPRCPALVLVSGRDEDVPPAASLALADALAATVIQWPESSHVGPLLGRDAAQAAAQTVAWLNTLAPVR